jgi:twitching motility protein PilT
MNADDPLLSLERLLARCLELDATDLHLAPGLPPIHRVQGALLRDESAGPLEAGALSELCDRLFECSGRASFDRVGAQDGAVGGPGGARFRFNVFRRRGAMAVALRRLDDRFRSLEALGLPASLYELCDLGHGLVLVVGPTGSGKSTTLAALLDHINRTRRAHVITIEDPIEYVHESRECLVSQRQVGADTPSFHAALVAALREDPDVILVGEARELDTVRTVLQAAETGHLVFATVHAGDCAGAIERLVSVFPSDEQVGVRRQLSLVLRAVVAQRLLLADGPRAARIGLKARVVASEVLTVTPAVANLVATGRCAQLASLIESSGRHGMQTFEADLGRLLAAGQLSEASVRAQTRHAADLGAQLVPAVPRAGGRRTP